MRSRISLQQRTFAILIAVSTPGLKTLSNREANPCVSAAASFVRLQGRIGIYLVILLLGLLTGLFAASDLALRKIRPEPAVWQTPAAICAAVVAVALLTYVPYVGFIVY